MKAVILAGGEFNPTGSSDIREALIPDWVRNNAGWWADGLILDEIIS